ncbi:hypothetical protein ANANG_G00168540 [Anguilla anguilla]|uniref:CARD domain-containing protein n=1 Tax=Anguilla anguilla TaxID=7936 RepID=A0A9D3RW57_ANGAN|nr:hypothetical protein ANANG_G00168540 [Anguilla anguilla]
MAAFSSSGAMLCAEVTASHTPADNINESYCTTGYYCTWFFTRNNNRMEHFTTPLSLPAVTFVNEHRAELIQKVTTVRSIADALYSKKMVDNELNSQIQAETTSQDKMRLLYKALDSAEAVKAAFFELLAQKQFPLVQDLAKKKLRQLEACDVDVP